MPYNYMFYEQIRDQCKIKIENNIIIFDEAHHCKRFSEDAESISHKLNSFPDDLQWIIKNSIRKLNLNRKRTIIVGKDIIYPLK